MFTKNFQRIMAYIFNPTSGYATGKSVNDTQLYCFMNSYLMGQGKEPTNSGKAILQTEGDAPSSSKNGWSLLLGTGDTPPTKDDLKLAAQATTLKALTRSCISNPIASGYSTSAVITNTFANYTEEPVTVKEMGLYYVMYDSSGVNGTMLAAREVLPEPITMNPGDIRTFQMTLDFSNI